LFAGRDFHWYDPSGTQQLEQYSVENSKFLMKRMHLIERIKDAKTLGILVGTLGASNYLGAVDRLKELAKQRGKKLYIIAVGKPSVTKLANFPEVMLDLRFSQW
jgi:diphthamide biosynthesis protein 2